jgi:hypothetical protein
MGFTFKVICVSCDVRVMNLLCFQGDLIPVFENTRYALTDVALKHERLDRNHDFIALNILVVLKRINCVRNFVSELMEVRLRF